MNQKRKKDIFLLYDGECYICQQFSIYVKLRKKYNVHIENAREDLHLIHRLQDEGYDINHGMLLITHE
jgi:CRISPR/Cas system-associated protein endoribonuclease Cas2